MKKSILLVVAAICLAACGKSGSKGHAFLDELGINTDSVQILGDTIDVSTDSIMYHLNNEQAARLLGGIAPEWANDSVEVTDLASIVAVKELPTGGTLAFLWQESGDGGTMYICTYDSDGKYADGMEFVNWKMLNQGFMEDNSSAYFSEKEDCGGRFTDNGFTIHRTLSGMKSDTEMAEFQPQWTIDKTYTYAVTPEGKLQLKSVDLKKQGNVSAQVLLRDEIRDFAKMPASDASIVEKLNTLAQRKDVQNIDEEDRSYGELLWTVNSVYDRYPKDMMKWLCQHKDSNGLAPLMKKADGYGVLSRERIDADIEKLFSGDDANYLKEATKDWFPQKQDTHQEYEEGDVVEEGDMSSMAEVEFDGENDGM